MDFKILSINQIEEIAELGYELNPTIDNAVVFQRLKEMFHYQNYNCFGMYLDDKLIAVASGWVTTRFYSGKQLEIDNLIVSSKFQSKGYGEKLMCFIENWALQHKFLTVELNTYVVNDRSHKFYFNQGYKILGYHFQKKLNA